MKLKLNISLFLLLAFTMSTVFAVTFTTSQAGGNSSKDLTVQVGKQYQLKFDLLHQTTNNVRIQILEGLVVLVDESNLIDGFHLYVLTPTSNVITLKFVREDNDNVIRDFQVGNLVYEEVASVAQSESNHELGRKDYELTDHLRNVRAVISDKKVNGNIEVISATDYLPFGMTARSYSNGVSVRHGFNGKEKDNEGNGGGGSTYDYGFRIYNPLLGRFLSVDPLSHSYPWNSTYSFAENDVISSIDLDGLEKFKVIVSYGAFGSKPRVTVSYVPMGSLRISNVGVVYIFQSGGNKGTASRSLMLPDFVKDDEAKTSQTQYTYYSKEDFRSKRNPNVGPLGDDASRGTGLLAQGKYVLNSSQPLAAAVTENPAPVLNEMYNTNGSVSGAQIDYDYIAGYMLANPTECLVITGKTDRQGSSAANDQLSANRVLDVRNNILAAASKLGLSQDEINNIDDRLRTVANGEREAASKGQQDGSQNQAERTTTVTLEANP